MSTIVITRESLRAAGACYFDEPEGERWLQKLLPPDGLPVTAASVELARAAGVPERDIFWALNNACPQVTDRQRRLVACACARRALDAERAAGRKTDPRSWRAVDVAERFARGEATETELADARLAAWETWKLSAAAWEELDSAASAAAWAEEWSSWAAEAWRLAVDAFISIINQEGN
jgi:hypothetical protein